MHWVVVLRWGELIQFELHSSWSFLLPFTPIPFYLKIDIFEECLWSGYHVHLADNNNDKWGNVEMNEEKTKITEKSTCQLATTTTMKYGDDFEEKKQDKTKGRKCVVTWLKQVTARHPSSWHSVTCSWGLWHLIFDFDVNFYIFDCLFLCLCLIWQTFMKLVNALVFVVVFVFEFVFVFIFLLVILFVFVFVLCLPFSVTWLPLRKLGSSSKWNRTIRWPSFTFLQKEWGTCNYQKLMMIVKNYNDDDEKIVNLMQPTRPCEVPMFAGALKIIGLLIFLMLMVLWMLMSFLMLMLLWNP